MKLCKKPSNHHKKLLQIEAPDYLKSCDPELPLPKGNSPYALAKRAEYVHKDLKLAKFYYEMAIKQGDRTESAIKDIASILHQEGRTEQACQFLETHRSHFRDQKKVDNLLTSLQKQIIPSENCLKRIIKLFPITDSATCESILDSFKNPSRILEVEFHFHNNIRCAFLKFQSHSSARKTLEGLNSWNLYKFEWVSAGELEEVKDLEFWTFALDTQEPSLSQRASTDEDTARLLIGAELFGELNEGQSECFSN
jgi:hypothetical protein